MIGYRQTDCNSLIKFLNFCENFEFEVLDSCVQLLTGVDTVLVGGTDTGEPSFTVGNNRLLRTDGDVVSVEVCVNSSVNLKIRTH